MRVPAHAAINESVNLAKQKASQSAAGFVNAVLRRISERSREQWIEKVLESADSADERLSLDLFPPTLDREVAEGCP